MKEQYRKQKGLKRAEWERFQLFIELMKSLRLIGHQTFSDVTDNTWDRRFQRGGDL